MCSSLNQLQERSDSCQHLPQQGRGQECLAWTETQAATALSAADCWKCILRFQLWEFYSTLRMGQLYFLCPHGCYAEHLACSSYFVLLFFSDVVFQPTIDGLSLLVPVAAMPGSQLLFSHPSGPTHHGCACSPGNDSPPGLAGLFLLFPAANLWDVGILPLPNENMAGGADLSSDL